MQSKLPLLVGCCVAGFSAYLGYRYSRRGALPSASASKKPITPPLEFKRDRNAVFDDMKMNEQEFLDLLKEIISYTKRLQNSPPAHVPEESLVVKAILRYLEPYIYPAGPLKVKELEYVRGRANLIVQYEAEEKTDRVVSFVGAHMDVVHAAPEEWSVDPFQLTIGEGGKLMGRGVTDCLGHVAALTCFFKELAIKKPKLHVNVVGVFIANEESAADLGIGIDVMEERGELEFLKHGPLYWVDSANFGPTLGTGGMITWSLTAVGKNFHSGLPHKAINPIPLAYLALRRIQERFYTDFAMEPKAREYLYEIGSSLKPTQVTMNPGSINSIPLSITLSGDIRLTPFWSLEEVKSKIEQYVRELDVSELQDVSYSAFELPEEKRKGRVEWRWLSEGMAGVACDLKSPGYAAICEAMTKVRGKVVPFSLTGSLPIIRSLAEKGYDVQITGFGRLDAYHASNEYGLLEEFEQGFRVVSRIIQTIDAL